MNKKTLKKLIIGSIILTGMNIFSFYNTKDIIYSYKGINSKEIKTGIKNTPKNLTNLLSEFGDSKIYKISLKGIQYTLETIECLTLPGKWIAYYKYLPNPKT